MDRRGPSFAPRQRSRNAPQFAANTAAQPVDMRGMVGDPGIDLFTIDAADLCIYISIICRMYRARRSLYCIDSWLECIDTAPLIALVGGVAH
jgi:hypothetical protein